MAKADAAEGNSCHIHLLLPLRATAMRHGRAGSLGLSATGAIVLAGMLAGLRELTLMFAPTSTPTSGTRRELRTDRGRLGAGQPDLRAG